MTNIPEKGDIVWVYIKDSVGREQSGRRPAVVISSKEYNENSSTILICPITTNSGEWVWKYQIPDINDVSGYVLVDKIQSIDYLERKSKIVSKLDIKSINIIAEMLIMLVKN
jgi:mRNA interferase MazF